jgi:hypothetical protein
MPARSRPWSRRDTEASLGLLLIALTLLPFGALGELAQGMTAADLVGFAVLGAGLILSGFGVLTWGIGPRPE